MTESDWLTSTDGAALLANLFPHTGRPPRGRKLQLYLIARCRTEWGRIPAAGRAAAEFVERYADDPRPDPATWAAVAHAIALMHRAYPIPEIVARCEQDLRAVGLNVPTGPPWRGTADEWFRFNRLVFAPLCVDTGPVFEFDHPADLVRCVFGNPFRPVAFDPDWRSQSAIDLARTMYESRDYGAMPVLADALEEAGCDNPDVLAHCRGDGPHARGCWVADHVLGK
jgi:hypothetical protein